MKTIQLNKKERIIFIACVVLAIATLGFSSIQSLNKKDNKTDILIREAELAINIMYPYHFAQSKNKK